MPYLDGEMTFDPETGESASEQPLTATPPCPAEPLRLSYRSLADRLGLSVSGARALAKRRQWVISRDDEGRTLVLVPPAELEPRTERNSALAPAAPTPAEFAARIAGLVAAIKAEREGEDRLLARERTSATIDLAALTRQLIAARDRERLEWEQTTDLLKAELAEAQSGLVAMKAEVDALAARHRRNLVDLEAGHADQRSIWQLERRRLEATIASLERSRQRKWSPRRWLAATRPAWLVVVIVLGAFGFSISKDHTRGTSGAIIHPVDDAHFQAGCGEADCARASDSVLGARTQFLVDGFLAHMAQELQVASPPRARIEP
ncbi:MAG TPA: hypothetical protein VEU47_15395 [Candidatus Cybelea sp.]|nr:hypothetical protein [Candidatus Cybelea sp.]